MTRPPESLKAAAEQLAELLSSGNDGNIVHPLLPEMHDGPGHYVLTRKRALGENSADVDRVLPKGNRFRTILLGESVARGVFYDPLYNPASALTGMLGSAMGLERVDMIDLARNDLRLDDLLKLAQKASTLEPDAFVVFAGNNWLPYSEFDGDALKDFQKIVSKGGWTSLRQHLETLLQQKARRVLKELGKLANSCGIPIVFIIPEFNLSDWRNEYGGHVPFLGSKQSAEWQEARDRMQEALQTSQWHSASQLAERMLELDSGTCCLTLEALAECSVKTGQHEPGNYWLERARDAGLAFPLPRSPRCFAAIQTVLRNEGDQYGISIVDLPSCMREFLGGESPDRRLFHDYCHLTGKGIRLAMALASEKLLSFVGYHNLRWRQIFDSARLPEPHIEAQAHFLAAFHNNRWGQSYDTICYHLRQAVSLAPDFCNTLRNCMDLQSRSVPSLLCQSLWRLHDHSMLGDRVLAWIGLDRPGNIEGIQFLAALSQISQAESLPIDGHESINLLDPFSLYGPDHQPGNNWRDHRSYYQSFEITSQFQFLSYASALLQLRLVFRVPGARSDQSVRLEVNDVILGWLPASSTWRVTALCLLPTVLGSGVNVICLRWPDAEWSIEEERARIAKRLRQGSKPDFRSVYGEIHTFEITVAGS